jgi:arginine repressor
MAKKSAKEGVNKSELTRQYIAKNPSANPKEIVAGLKAEGVEISFGLANKMKYDKSAKGRRKKAAAPDRDNKAEAIRAAAKSLGKKVRPRDIIAMLKEQGIAVSSAQVSTTLKSMGMKRTRRGRKAGAVAAAGREPITIEDLIAAKKLVNQLGSIEAASQAISALAKLG